jgi:DNA polymerase I-like protein with 3'-5' exonuclease and polymerase domains
VTSPPPSYSNPLEFDLLMLEPVHHMMMKGIRVDLAEKKRLQEEALAEWTEQQAMLDKVVDLVGGASLNVESKKWVPHLLYKELGLPTRTKQGKVRADESALRELMAICDSKIRTLKTEGAKRRWMEGFIICRQIINIRRKRKEISSFLGLHIEKGKVIGPAPFEDKDGRIRGTISVGGTKTARFSHSKTLWDTGVNQATVPDRLRTMYIPDEGYEFAEFDLNRGESWIYSHLSEDPELLRIHLNGLDFHAETAAAISSEFDSKPRTVEWIVENRKGDAFRLRYLGKRINHASSYGMRAFKGAEVVNSESDETGVTVTVSEYNKAHEIWLAKYWMIPRWWKDIEDQLEKTRTLITPYGRRLTFHDRWGDKLIRDATAYVPQSTSVDYLNRGFLQVFFEFVKTGAWGLNVLTQTHDSILVQYKTEHRDEAIPAIAHVLGDRSLTIKDRTFRIPIEASYGSSWGTLKPYALAT